MRREVLYVVGFFQTVGTAEHFDTSALQAFGALGIPLPQLSPVSGLRNDSNGDGAFHHTINCRNRARFWWCMNTSLPFQEEKSKWCAKVRAGPGLASDVLVLALSSYFPRRSCFSPGQQVSA